MKTYMIRTCYFDMTSYGGFTWPESGNVACPDWDPAPICGHGLHGLLLGCGNGNLLNWSSEAKWLVVEVEKEDIVDLGGKIKVNKGTVIYSGPRKEAIAKLEALAPECLLMPVVGASRIAGNDGIATAGHCGTAIAGDHGTATAGVWGKATAGFKGTATAGAGGTATAGDHGTAFAGYEGTAIAGAGGTATAGDNGTAFAGYAGTAIAGNCGTATAGPFGHAIAGEEGTAMAGYRGKISIDWWHEDEKTNEIKTIIGYIGENGIEPSKPYRVDQVTGKLIRKF